MNKTKFVLAGFAIFAATIMLLTPCIAKPVAEKNIMDATENAQRELINSLESLNVKLSRNYKASALLNSIKRDQDVSYILNNIQRAATEEEIIVGLEQLGIFLQDNPELIKLVNIIEQECTYELGVISQQIELISGNDDDIPWWLDFLLTLAIILSYVLYFIQLINVILAFIRDWLNGG